MQNHSRLSVALDVFFVFKDLLAQVICSSSRVERSQLPVALLRFYLGESWFSSEAP